MVTKILQTVMFSCLGFLLLMNCAPVSSPTDPRTDQYLVGIWRRDNDSSGTDSQGDDLLVLYSNGDMVLGDYRDPDGGGPEPFQWLTYSYGYEWLNGYVHDDRNSPPPNNYYSGNVLLDDGSGTPFLLFQYRYSIFPDELEVLTANSYEGLWERQ